MISARSQTLAQLWSPQVLFILRTLIAMLLALAIAFRLDLSNPGSAAVTVSIIALPQVGMVLEKSVYRLMGTLLGACAALFLVGVFAQHQYSFIVAVALWIGICTAASEWFRGFRAYGWLLSGYTAYLVGFAAFIDVPHAFNIAVDRVSIVSVGILSAGIVNATFFPTRSAPLMDERLRQVLRDCAALFAATSAADPATLRRKQSGFALDLGELESARRSSILENPVSRARTGAVLSLVQHLTLLLGHLQILRRHLDSLPTTAALIRQQATAVLSRCHEILQDWEGAPVEKRRATEAIGGLERLLKETASWVAIDADRDHKRSEHQAAATVTRRLLNDSIQQTIAVIRSYTALENPNIKLPASRIARVHDPADARHALLSGVRSSVVVLLTCAYWILTEWPNGSAAVLFAAFGSALFAAYSDPRGAAWQMCTGALIALPALFLCFAYVLPAADGFCMLALGLTPFIVFGAWQMTRPRWVLQGNSYFIIFLAGLNLNGVMRYDFLSMISLSTASVAGLVVAMLSLAVIRPANLRWRAVRTARRLVGCLTLLRGSLTPDTQFEFHRTVRDWTAQLVSLSRDQAGVARAESLAAIVLELGDALMTLRRVDSQLAMPLRAELARCLDETVIAILRSDRPTLRSLDADLASLHRRTALTEETESVARRDARAHATGATRTLRLSVQALIETGGDITEEYLHAA